jgi:hypothetical protein
MKQQISGAAGERLCALVGWKPAVAGLAAREEVEVGLGQGGEADLFQPYRPWHTFDERQPLQPGEPVDVDVEIWLFSVIIDEHDRGGSEFRGTTTLYAGGGPGRLLLGFSQSRGPALRERHSGMTAGPGGRRAQPADLRDPLTRDQWSGSYLKESWSLVR